MQILMKVCIVSHFFCIFLHFLMFSDFSLQTQISSKNLFHKVFSLKEGLKFSAICSMEEGVFPVLKAKGPLEIFSSVLTGKAFFFNEIHSQ